MNFRAVRLPDGVPGALWLSAMPGRFDAFSSFEEDARRENVALVVCLTPRAEVRDLSPAYHAALAQGPSSWRWLNLPIPNFGVPDDAPAFRDGVMRIANALRAGESVMMHCAAGIGRTGSTAACVLKALGLDTQEALSRVKEAGSNPENAKQSGFVEWF